MSIIHKFYCLYLKPWDDEANKPSDAILEGSSYKGKSEPTPTPEGKDE